MPHPDGGLGPLSRERLDAMALALAGDPEFAAMPRLDPLGPAEHARALVGDINDRLRRACGHLGDDEFAAVVFDVARMRIRFDRLDRAWAASVGRERDTL